MATAHLLYRFDLILSQSILHLYGVTRWNLVCDCSYILDDVKEGNSEERKFSLVDLWLRNIFSSAWRAKGWLHASFVGGLTRLNNHSVLIFPYCEDTLCDFASWACTDLCLTSALAASHRMVYGVHCCSPHPRPSPEMSSSTSRSQLPQMVLDIGDHANRTLSLDRQVTYFTR